MKKKVLVTGSEGFIGSHLFEGLLRKNYNVTALVLYNSFSDIGWLKNIKKNKKLKIVFGDLTSFDLIKNISRNCEKIFHLGAQISIPYSYKSPDAFLNNNVKGTINILQAAKINKVKKVIVTSTSEVYGSAIYTPMDENHPMNAQSPYSASKISADKFSESFALSFDLPVIIARPFNNYGPRQSTRAIIPTIIRQLLSNSKINLGNINTSRDFVFVEDTVDAIIRLSNSKYKNAEVFNICSGKSIKVSEIVKLISTMLKKKSEIIIESKRRRPKKSEVNLLLGSNKKIKNKIKWKPKTNLKAGLEKTIKWFQKENNIKLYPTTDYNL